MTEQIPLAEAPSIPAGASMPKVEPTDTEPPSMLGEDESALVAGLSNLRGSSRAGDAGRGEPEGEVVDPEGAGPPWKRLVAGEGYVPPRLLRWPIVAGVVVLASVVALYATVIAQALRETSGAAAPYSLTAADAQFTATFPSRPFRTVTASGSAPAIVYTSTLADHAIAVTYVRLAGGFDLDAAVRGVVAAQPGATLASHSRLTYRGQEAEDGAIVAPQAYEQVRVVTFGSAVYVLEGAGQSRASFASDYNALLASFSSSSPATSRSSGAASAAAPGTPAASTPAASTPAASTPAAQPRPLVSVIVPAPAGFAAIADPAGHTGAVSAAVFDSLAGQSGAATQFHFVTGYRLEYGNSSSGDLVLVALYRFMTAQDAEAVQAGLSSPPAGEKSVGFPAIPGSSALDSTAADSSGAFDHVIVASKDGTVMYLEEPTGGAARPAALGVLARQQFARL